MPTNDYMTQAFIKQSFLTLVVIDAVFLGRLPLSDTSAPLSRNTYGTNNILSHGGPSAAHVTSHHSYTQPPPSAAPSVPAAAPGQAPVGAAGASMASQGLGGTQQSQPVEFNHAINYVNKIKVRS